MSVEQIFSLIAALMIASCVRVHAQFGVEQPFFFQNSVAAQTPEQLASSGLAYRWVASDLPTNVTVTNWTDRVQGMLFEQNNTSVRPTNAATGIWLDATHYLSNGPLVIDTNVSFAFILNIASCTGNAGIRPGLYMNNAANTLGDTIDVAGYCFDDSSAYLLWQGGANQYNISPSSYTGKEGKLHDLIFDQRYSGTSYILTYTNAVQMYSNILQGNKWLGTCVPNYPNSLGWNRGRNASPYWRLSELWIWTNSPTGSGLPETVRSNFHCYATNAYGFSP